MTFKVYDDAQATARAVVECILLKMKEVETFSIAFSGGNTPALLFKIWLEEYSSRTDWNKIRFFWVDERCVPADSPESNFGNMKRQLLDNINACSSNVFPIDGEIPAAKSAELYSETVTKNLPLSGGVPVFDMIILGMGDDGHTSSIFPGQEGLLKSDKLFIESENPYSHQKRVAMTPRLMFAAKNLIFHVTGKGKYPAMQRLKQDASSGPAAYVAWNSSNALFFTDKEAVE